MTRKMKRFTHEQREALFSVMTDRGIDHYSSVCYTCQGQGVRVYCNTTTWHGGIGGQSMTSDVCDKCWGSGNIDRPWLSHRSWDNALKRHGVPVKVELLRLSLCGTMEDVVEANEAGRIRVDGRPAAPGYLMLRGQALSLLPKEKSK